MKRGIAARRFTKALLQDGFVLDRIAEGHHIFTHTDGRVVPVAFSRDSQTFRANAQIAISFEFE